MPTKDREVVESTPFSDFVRHASVEEKRKLFNKVIQGSVAEQKALIVKAEAIRAAY
ncbi:MAG: hypothetical protein JJV99_01795 [Colwellia sp.]|nr:hypothetical protein [Colwellia sp.]